MGCASMFYEEFYKGGEAHPVTNRTAVPVRYELEDTSFNSLLKELAMMARVMREEVLDGSGGLKGDVSLREARETFVASANLLSIIARNQELAEKGHNISLFQTALVESLRELDAEIKGRFLDKFERRLSSLVNKEKLAA